jgi:uncharacterized membrane protein
VATTSENEQNAAAKAVESGMANPAEPKSLNALTRKNIELICELEKLANVKRTRTDRMAAAISRFVGSMGFVYVHVLWFGAWIALGVLPGIPKAWKVDPFPFTFLTFVVSLEAIFLSTFILISQNHEERLARRRNHLDLQINLLSEQENSQMLKMLEAIGRRLHIEGDPRSRMLEEDTSPKDMGAQIDAAIEKDQAAG